MTASARTALLNIGTRRQGAAIASSTPAEVIEELQELGLIGKGLGLTRKGSIKREILLDEDLDARFG